MDPRALKAAGGLALVAVALAGAALAAEEKELFAAMAALRVSPPTAAPDVTFRSLDGGEARLRELRGKPVLLGFFTTW